MKHLPPEGTMQHPAEPTKCKRLKAECGLSLAFARANVAESAFTCRRKRIPPVEGWPRFLLWLNKEPGVVKL